MNIDELFQDFPQNKIASAHIFENSAEAALGIWKCGCQCTMKKKISWVPIYTSIYKKWKISWVPNAALWKFVGAMAPVAPMLTHPLLSKRSTYLRSITKLGLVCIIPVKLKYLSCKKFSAQYQYLQFRVHLLCGPGSQMDTKT